MGASRITKLRQAGIETPLDLCCRFPNRYIDLSLINRFELFSEGDEVSGYGRVLKIEKKIIRKNLSYVKAEFIMESGGLNSDLNSELSNSQQDGTGNNINGGKFWATWFNQRFMANVLKPGKECFVVGRLKYVAGRIEISAPTFINPDKSSKIIPVYRSVGIPSTILKEAIKIALKEVGIDGFLNMEARQKYGLMDTQKAFFAAHFPKSLQEAKEARRSLSIENLAGYIALYHRVKEINCIQKKPHSYHNKHNPLLYKLPFELTGDQLATYNSIAERLNAATPANILIEGDVGCGKTIVCFLAMSLAAENDHQSVLMAPTEILARQHFLTAQKFFGISNKTKELDSLTQDGNNLTQNEIEFLSGSQTAAQRAASLFNIRYGNAKIIIGTHSVFSKDVIYRDLTLVITDEQHRFGVTQRGALENKSFAPDRIVMSATPIPRTLALTLYGELDLIALRQKPLKKAKVFTRFVGGKVPQMYDYIREKASKGEQTIIVCPRIEGDDELELTGAEELYKQLQRSFDGLIGLLHGKMRDADKIQVMDDFTSGAIKILVSTTIIEVGMDIPAATTIVIYNAERYGLSQLHQLRGRVGRGITDSYCFLICKEEAYQSRLKFLAECEDGFELAEKDFELRGAGDFLGLRQHGASLTFTGEPVTLELLKIAKEVSSYITSGDLGDLSGTELFFKELALN